MKKIYLICLISGVKLIMYRNKRYGFFGSIASAKIKNLNMLNANIDTLSAGNVVGAITSLKKEDFST